MTRDRLLAENGGQVYSTYFDVARRFLFRMHDQPQHPTGARAVATRCLTLRRLAVIGRAARGYAYPAAFAARSHSQRPRVVRRVDRREAFDQQRVREFPEPRVAGGARKRTRAAHRSSIAGVEAAVTNAGMVAVSVESRIANARRQGWDRASRSASASTRRAVRRRCGRHAPRRGSRARSRGCGTISP